MKKLVIVGVILGSMAGKLWAPVSYEQAKAAAKRSVEQRLKQQAQRDLERRGPRLESGMVVPLAVRPQAQQEKAEKALAEVMVEMDRFLASQPSAEAYQKMVTGIAALLDEVSNATFQKFLKRMVQQRNKARVDFLTNLSKTDNFKRASDVTAFLKKSAETGMKQKEVSSENEKKRVAQVYNDLIQRVAKIAATEDEAEQNQAIINAANAFDALSDDLFNIIQDSISVESIRQDTNVSEDKAQAIIFFINALPLIILKMKQFGRVTALVNKLADLQVAFPKGLPFIKNVQPFPIEEADLKNLISRVEKKTKQIEAKKKSAERLKAIYAAGTRQELLGGIIELKGLISNEEMLNLVNAYLKTLFVARQPETFIETINILSDVFSIEGVRQATISALATIFDALDDRALMSIFRQAGSMTNPQADVRENSIYRLKFQALADIRKAMKDARKRAMLFEAMADLADELRRAVPETKEAEARRKAEEAKLQESQKTVEGVKEAVSSVAKAKSPQEATKDAAAAANLLDAVSDNVFEDFINSSIAIDFIAKSADVGRMRAQALIDRISVLDDIIAYMTNYARAARLIQGLIALRTQYPVMRFGELSRRFPITEARLQKLKDQVQKNLPKQSWTDWAWSWVGKRS